MAEDIAESAESVARQTERRVEVRRLYSVTQLVAFHDEARTPTKEMFLPLLCQDISTSGISFYHAGPHYGPYLGPNQEWIIGCQFLSKVKKPF